ncbi:hypothetical protein M0R45_025739 [Rubus argutus]|uniref:Uncharacterized protein n=1 Tax=Rubus argutus TaxID=59490 RepID=A0AAW1WV24_RUBAR
MAPPCSVPNSSTAIIVPEITLSIHDSHFRSTYKLNPLKPSIKLCHEAQFNIDDGVPNPLSCSDHYNNSQPTLIHVGSDAEKPKPNFSAHQSSQMPPSSFRCLAAFPAASPTKPRLTFLLYRCC